MGPDQLAGVMETIQRASAEGQGRKVDDANLQMKVDSFRDSVQRDSECYRTSAECLDDGIIDPRDTRDVIGMCLEVVKLPGVQGSDSYRVLARI